MEQTDKKMMALRVEHFENDEDFDFRIKAKVEMLYILRGMSKQKEDAALYFNAGQDFILTRLLEVDEDGMWLDVSASPEKNQQIPLSDKIIFVGLHQHVKIQFATRDIEIGLFEGGEAFYLEMPEFILRILRREFFRIPIPRDTFVKCTIPTPPKSSDDRMFMNVLPVAEISGDGIGLVCDEDEDTLLPGKTFRDCQIEIPDFGTLKVTLKVRTNNTFITPQNVVRKRVGCQLIFLDSRMEHVLQRYIIHLQGELKKIQAAP